MIQEVSPFFKKRQIKASVAIFLSGLGTNAEKILQHQQQLGQEANFNVTCLVTDCPKSSRTYQIAEKFNLPVVAFGLKNFYRQHGLQSTSLASEKGREIRQLWTDELIQLLKPHNIDFGVFAGFVPLSNITNQLPCLNIHPGDLTYERDGRRVLVGLHTLPIRLCLEEGLKYMRSTVIVASAYQDKGNGMDGGVILALSKEVKMDLPIDCEKLLQNKEILQKTLEINQNKLKKGGDWNVFPYTIDDFAKGIFGLDSNNRLVVKINQRFLPCRYIEYDGLKNKVVNFT